MSMKKEMGREEDWREGVGPARGRGVLDLDTAILLFVIIFMEHTLSTTPPHQHHNHIYSLLEEPISSPLPSFLPNQRHRHPSRSLGTHG